LKFVVQGAVYGEGVKADGYVPNFHLDLLEPTIKELAEMEVASQNLFLELEKRFTA